MDDLPPVPPAAEGQSSAPPVTGEVLEGPRALAVRAFGDDLVASVEALYVPYGAAETSRRLGVPRDLVERVARARGLNAVALVAEVAAARAEVLKRLELQELRRFELRETLLLVAERAAEETLSTLDGHRLGWAQQARDLSVVLKVAMDELRTEMPPPAQELPAGQAEPPIEDELLRRRQLRDRVAAAREQLAMRREAERVADEEGT